MSIPFSPYYKSGRLSFEVTPNATTFSKGIRTHNPIVSAIKNILKAMGIGRGTVRVKFESGQSWRLNRNSAIKWIKNNHDKEDISQLKKLDNKDLIDKIAFICAKELMKLDDKDSLIKALNYFNKIPVKDVQTSHFLKEIIKKLLKGNSPEALLIAGEWHEKGMHDYKKSHAEAANFYSQAITHPTTQQAALEAIQRLVEASVPEALHMMGKLHMTGANGVEKSETKAQEYLSSALEKGGEALRASVLRTLQHAADEETPVACLMVGRFYMTGNYGLEQSVEEGIKYLTIAEKAENVQAQYELGKYYLQLPKGRDTHGNARSYLQKAANAGYAPAQFELGILEGTHNWFSKAAAQGHLASQIHLGKIDILQGKYDIAKETFARIAELELTPENHPQVSEAFYYLGIIYENPRVGEQSLEKAFDWYQKADSNGKPAKRDILKLAKQIGQLALDAQDYAKAERYLTIGAEGNDAEAQYMLAFLFEKQGIETQEMINWYDKAARQNHRNAQYRLGLFLAQRSGSVEQAIELLDEAASQNHRDAQFELGKIYYDQENYEKALTYFNSAASNNHFEASCYIGYMIFKGLGNVPDHRLALNFLKEIGERDSSSPESDTKQNGEIQYLIAGIFEESGFRTKALEWVRKSAQLGYSAAKKKLEGSPA